MKSLIRSIAVSFIFFVGYLVLFGQSIQAQNLSGELFFTTSGNNRTYNTPNTRTETVINQSSNTGTETFSLTLPSFVSLSSADLGGDTLALSGSDYVVDSFFSSGESKTLTVNANVTSSLSYYNTGGTIATFTGSGSINIGDLPGVSTAFSLFARVRDIDPNTNAQILAKDDGTTDRQRSLWYRAGGYIDFVYHVPGGLRMIRTNSTFSGESLDIGVVYDESNALGHPVNDGQERVTIYVQGQQVHTTLSQTIGTLGSISDTSTAIIAGTNLSGSLRDIRLRNRTLTQNDMNTVSNYGLSDTLSSGLLSHYPLAAGSGNIAYDISPNALTGSFTNVSFVSHNEFNFATNLGYTNLNGVFLTQPYNTCQGVSFGEYMMRCAVFGIASENNYISHTYDAVSDLGVSLLVASSVDSNTPTQISLTVQNTGSDSDDSTLVVSWTGDLTFPSLPSRVLQDNNTLIIDIPQLAQSESYSLNITGIFASDVTLTGNIQGKHSNDTSSTSTTLLLPNINITSSLNTTGAKVGDIFTQTITVQNNGSGTAQNIVLQHLTHNGQTYLDSNALGLSGYDAMSVSGDLVGYQRNLGSLTPSESTNVIFISRIDESFSDLHLPCSTANSICTYSSDGNGATHASSLPYISSTDLSLSGATSGNVAGDTLDRSLTLTNHGPDTSDFFASVSGEVLTGTLLSGESTLRNISLPVPDGADIITLTGTLSGDIFETNNTNNTLSAIFTVLSPDLSITKTTPQTSAQYNDIVNYTLSVTNTGNLAATGVIITDILSTGVQLLSYDSNKTISTYSTGIFDDTSWEYRWETDTLGVGETRNINLTGQVIESFGGGNNALSGRAYSFDGVNDRGTIPGLDQELATGSSDFSRCFWIKNTDASGSTDAILSTQRSDFSGGFVIYLNGTRFRIINAGNGGFWISNTDINTVAINEVAHICIQKVDDQYEIYKNNILIPQNIESTGGKDFVNPGELRLGYRDYNPSIVKGMGIRDIRLYTESKNDNQRSLIMNGGIDRNELVAWYKGDEGSGTIAYDSSGNGHHGTLINGVGYTNTTGFSFKLNYGYTQSGSASIPRDESNQCFDVLGNSLQYFGQYLGWCNRAYIHYDNKIEKSVLGSGRAYSFDGINDSLHINYLGSSSKLITFWIKIKDISKGNQIYFGNSSGGRFYIGFWYGKMLLGVGNTAYTNGPAYPIDASKRHHVALLDDGNFIHFVINGTSQRQVAKQNGTDGINRFGNVNGVHYSNMDIYDSRIYYGEKTLSDIQYIMNGGIDTDGLNSHYKTDEGSGTIAYDSSGNGNHGTLINGVSHITHTGINFRESLGYNTLNGVSIPRNESQPCFDVLGNILINNACLYDGAFTSYERTSDIVTVGVQNNEIYDNDWTYNFGVTNSGVDSTDVIFEYTISTGGTILSSVTGTLLDPQTSNGFSLSGTATGDFILTVTAISDIPDQNITNNSVSVIFDHRIPILELEKTVVQTGVIFGDIVNYTLSVTNTGEAIATGVIITDILSTGVQLLSYDSNKTISNYSTGTYDDTSWKYTRETDTLGVGETRNINLTGQVVESFGWKDTSLSGRAYSFDGVNDYIQASHISSQTIISYEGTSILSIGASQINATAGYAHSILLSDGTFYKGDEGSGTIAYDSSGNGHHGTLINGVGHTTTSLFSFRSNYGYTQSGSISIPRDESNQCFDVLGSPLQYYGQYLGWCNRSYSAFSGQSNSEENIFGEGRAYSFDGVNDYIQTDGIEFFQEDFEISFSYEHTSNTAGFRTLFSNSYNGAAGGFAMYLSNNQLNLYRGAPYVNMGTIGPILQVGETYEIQLIRSGNNFSYVINGISYALSSYTGDFGGNLYIYVGRSSSGYYNNMKIWNIKVTGGGETLLLYKGDEGSENIAYDSSGNGNHGTLINGVSHTTHTGINFRESLGYNMLNGVSIPRNESDQCFDVLGNILIHNACLYNGAFTRYLPQKNLSLTKTADRESATYGDTITYSLAVTNTGIDPVYSSEIVTDSTATGMTYLSGTQPLYSSILTSTGQTRQRSVPSLLPGQAFGWDYDLKVDRSFGVSNISTDGRSYIFDGYDDVVDGGVLNLGNSDMTLSMWIKGGPQPSNTYLFGGWGGYQGTPGHPAIQIGFNIQTSNLHFWHPSLGSVRATTNIQNNQRYHITFTDIGNTVNIYVNGIKESSLTGGPITYNNWWILAGGTNLGNPYHYNGKIRDIRVYSIGKSDQEIVNIMNGEVDLDSIERWYKMDEGSGNIAYDSSGLGNHGTLINGTQHNQESITPYYNYTTSHGYTQSGSVSIPRDESNQCFDVLGHKLTHKGSFSLIANIAFLQNNITCTYTRYLPYYDLQIFKTADLTTAKQGDIINYALGYYSSGLDTAYDISITDTLDSALSLTSGSLVTNITSIAPGQTGLLLLSAEVQSGAGLFVTNTASISGSYDINTGNNIASVSTDIDNIPPTSSIFYFPPASSGWTNNNVTATLTGWSEDIFVQNNSGLVSHEFSEDGSFEFVFRDIVGLTGTTTATVDWIDKVPVSLSEVRASHTPAYLQTQVTLTTINTGHVVRDDDFYDIVSFSGTNNDILIAGTGYTLSKTLTFSGYRSGDMTVIDKAGNTSIYPLEINPYDVAFPHSIKAFAGFRDARGYLLPSDITIQRRTPLGIENFLSTGVILDNAGEANLSLLPLLSGQWFSVSLKGEKHLSLTTTGVGLIFDLTTGLDAHITQDNVDYLQPGDLVPNNIITAIDLATLNAGLARNRPDLDLDADTFVNSRDQAIIMRGAGKVGK